MIKLSPKLSRAIAEDAMDCITGEPSLAKKDVDVLARILAGKEEASVPVSRKRAVSTFVRVTPPGQSVEVLAKILLDASEFTATRLSAAWGLGRTAGPEAEEALIRALGETSGSLQREVVKALGRVGSQDSLEALDAVAADDDAALGRLLALSRTLVSYRAKGGKPDPGKIKERVGVDWVDRKPKRLSGDDLRKHIDALRDDSFGIGLSGDIGFELDCGDDGANVVLFNDEIDAERLVDSLLGRSRLAALVTLQNPREQRGTPRYLVLSNRTDGGADIVVTRTSGQVVLAGEAVRDGDELRFTVRDVGIGLPPMSVTGVVTKSGIEMSVRSTGQRGAKAGRAI